MKAKFLAATPLAAAAIFGVVGCAAATTSCTVQHHYAIVIFQSGVGNNSASYVTQFRLNVKYGVNDTMHWLIRTDIVLGAATGNNPPLIVRTYRVGHALGCSVTGIRTHQ